MTQEKCELMTHQHIRRVQQLLGQVIRAFSVRQERYDESKLRSPEAEVFRDFTEKLAN